MRREAHVRFGERPGETDREQPRHRAPGRLDWQLAQSIPRLEADVDQPGVPAGVLWSAWQRRAGWEQVLNRQLRSRAVT